MGTFFGFLIRSDPPGQLSRGSAGCAAWTSVVVQEGKKAPNTVRGAAEDPRGRSCCVAPCDDTPWVWAESHCSSPAACLSNWQVSGFSQLVCAVLLVLSSEHTAAGGCCWRVLAGGLALFLAMSCELCWAAVSVAFYAACGGDCDCMTLGHQRLHATPGWRRCLCFSACSFVCAANNDHR
jgi:hypothetical protein